MLSASAAIFILRRATYGERWRRRGWLTLAGACAGLGAWATHFVSMLGYDPGGGFGTSYDFSLTLGSLLIAVVATTVGFNLAVFDKRSRVHALAGIVVGGGYAAMHYTGMLAVEMMAEFRWSVPHVIASVVFAVGFMIPALTFGFDRRRKNSALLSGSLAVLAVLSLHFTAMAGTTLIPHSRTFDSSGMLSDIQLAAMISLVSLFVLACGMFAAFVSYRVQVSAVEHEREFRIFVQGISDCAIYMLTPDGHVANWNAGAARLKGYTAAEAVGLPLEAFYGVEDRLAGKPAQALRRARLDGRYSAEGWRMRKDGSRFWALATIEAVRDDKGRFRGFAKITRDMTETKADKDRLLAVTANLDAALSNMHQGLCMYSADRRLVLWNERYCEIYGIAPDSLAQGMLFEDVLRLTMASVNGEPLSDEGLRGIEERLDESMAQGAGGSMDINYANGLHVYMSHHRLDNGGWVTTYEDVTAHRRSEAQIAHMALHDDLTGLPNRTYFNRRLDAAIASAKAGASHVGVAVIDLDRFKEVNDTWGHAAGDALLSKIGERLSGDDFERVFFARLGGDEFAAFFHFRDKREAEDLVSGIEDAFATHVTVSECTFSAGASIGFAAFPENGENREHVLNNADLAMYRAKNMIGTRICQYEKSMDEKARAERQLANDLRQAIERNELSLAYQAQLSLATDEIVGYEALLRWNHSRLGPIPPSRFIPIAEQTGEILPIGEWVLREACLDAAKWEKPWKLAVNLSPVQLLQADLMETVLSTLAETGLSPNRLELEITETAIVADKERALHILRSIKALGVTVAIDDFGTGYSSLDTLNSFPFDKIKIDKSFLLESGKSAQARAIIRAVLALGRSLQVPVLAEGLESWEQLDLLKVEGCDEAQGYLLGRPRAAGELWDGARVPQEPLAS
ncbi:EAL domain-containing protein [Novosphingobium sp. PC22D]|uniref:bifunctional diguanylate cyclase/phosphodiesterase n=1 Tax=Novosphingobium sp. PC22D TaxID=1962403 RepID=UPI001F0A322B|nr:EAL domain-containing protein [Novosphingobium sp. PC22D]